MKYLCCCFCLGPVANKLLPLNTDGLVLHFITGEDLIKSCTRAANLVKFQSRKTGLHKIPCKFSSLIISNLGLLFDTNGDKLNPVRQRHHILDRFCSPIPRLENSKFLHYFLGNLNSIYPLDYDLGSWSCLRASNEVPLGRV